MQFLSPMAGLIAAALTVPVLVLLYFLKLRRQQMPVPSTLLWRQAIQDLEVNSPFQRLRRNLLLLLQLLILAGLLLAFARPTTLDIAQPGQQVVIVVDHSASMNAMDVTPSRLDQAMRSANSLIDALDARQGMSAMVVSLAGRAEVRQPLTSDQARLRDAVRQIQPTDETADWQAAAGLIEPFARQAGDAGLVVYLVSDAGGLSDVDSLNWGPGTQVRQLLVGSDSAENVGWVTLSARRVMDDPQRVDILARLAGTLPQNRPVNVAVRVNDQVVRSESLDLPAVTADGQPGVVTWRFHLNLPGAAVLEVRHDVVDHLPADNRAAVVVAGPQQVAVVLVSPGNVFLQRALEAVQAVGQVRTMSPAELDATSDPAAVLGQFDLIVLDRHELEVLPDRPTLHFASLPAVAGLARRDRSATAPAVQMMLDWHRQHPVLRHVGLDDVLMTEPGRLVLPDDATVLATAQSGPVLAAVQVGATPHVVASFDLMQTNWPMQVSFPVFISNVVEHLVLGDRAQVGQHYQPGQVVHVGLPADRRSDARGQVRYRGVTDLAGRATGSQAVVGPIRRAGVYEARDPVQPAWQTLAVNVASLRETDIRLPIQVRDASVGTQPHLAGQTTMVQREWWRWFVWAALVVLLIEWAVYLRRMRV